MRKLLILTVGLLILLTSILASCATATPVYYPGNGHYYAVISVPGGITWRDANTSAQSLSYSGMHGHLATITSQDENNFIVNLGGHDYWLGGIQLSGSPESAGGWQWITGEPWVYTNWDSGEPSNSYWGGYPINLPNGFPEDALHFHGNSRWNDVPKECPVPGYIVEYELVNPPISEPPVANFSSNVTSGYAPLTVQFNDQSENVTEWNWDFGDGNNSNEQSPTHTYSAAGTYIVNLTASNTEGTNSKLVTISVLTTIPVYYSGNGHYYDAISVPGGITWSNAKTTAQSLSYSGMHGHLATITSPEENNFIFSTFNHPIDYYLGGFQPSGSPEPAGGWQWITDEPWDAPGTPIWAGWQPDNWLGREHYLLTYYGDGWNDGPDSPNAGYIVEYESTSQSSPVLPVANFSSNVTQGYAPLTVQFNNSSLNATGWNWDFGDENISVEQSPMHTYSIAGNYTVNLTVRNVNGTDSKLATITVVAPLPVPPQSISNIQSSNGSTWINWTWINPNDSDFDHTEIYLNGTFQTNISAEYFNETGLQPDKTYTIGTRTVGNNGNINETWVNSSAKTLSLPDTTLPAVESIILFPTSTATGSIISVTVNATDNVGVISVSANDIALLNQGGNIWNGSITALEGTHSVNVSAVDGVGNAAWNNTTSYKATTPDNLSPMSITSLQSIGGTTWINWTWTNPNDPDFNHTEIYLNGIFQASASAENFNATNLQSKTNYTLSTRTVDNNENVNETWVNSTATTGSETVNENFNVSISTDKSIYDRGETVHFTGKAQYADGSPIVNAPALLSLKLKGYTQTYSLVTDSNGNVSYDFKPGKTEAGSFTAKLSVNSNGQLTSAETSFNIYGLYMIPSGIVDIEMSKNSSENITFSLWNYGETDLHGLNVQLDGETIPGVETQVLQMPAETLASGAQGSFIVKISSSNVDVSRANYTVRVTSDEGSYEEAKLFVHLLESRPVAVVSPMSIEVGVNPDNNLVKTIDISNEGYESMNDITISRPSLEWVSVSSTNMGSISPGMNKSLNIFLHPGNNTAVGVYRETITLSSSNHQPVNVYLRISVTSSEKGDLKFHVINDLGENVSGASIKIQNPAALTEIFTGTANENGYYTFENVSAGTYNYFVTASGHSVSGSSIVSPGIQIFVEPMLPKDILGVKLNVTLVRIDDDYVITPNFVFETDVPPPLLIPDPVAIIHGVDPLNPVYEKDGNITISNSGLISVFNVTVDSSALQGINITFPTGQTFFVDEIKAKSFITIPYHLKVNNFSCSVDEYRNSIRISGDYIYFEPRSDVTHKGYVSSEIPVFAYMYNCPVDTPSLIEDYFTYTYNAPAASYSPIPIVEPIPQVETVHERVKFNIPQKATLERDAFDASLELTNKLTDKNIEEVSVNLTIKDNNGNDASSLFFVSQPSLSNINSIDGNGIISPSSIANANWLLVPKKNTGGTSSTGKDYTVQALINYTVNGLSFSINSTEESITVMPQPLLNLTYTIPEKVKADMPFNLSLIVTNVGYGTARNLKFDSCQPKIYENKAGLLVSFELIDGGLVNGPGSNSMLIDFGDLAPGESKEAYWVMKTSLDGNFTEFNGSFSHSNVLGGSETSLINDIRYIIIKESDTTPPSSITNIQSTNSTTWINWIWTNPEDIDFSHTEIYLNGTFQKDTSEEYFNATELQPETDYTISTRTLDNSGNVNETWINATVKTLALPDTTFPEINSVILYPISTRTGSPIDVTVDVRDNVKVTGVKANEVDLVNQGGSIWNGTISAIEGTNPVNVSAVDGAGNIAWNNSTSYNGLTTDTQTPSSITNLQSTNGTIWINWTWQNPTDLDFNHTEIYLNGTFQTDILEEYFNATELQPETSYTLSTRTVDNSGNINETWVNSTATTSAELSSDTEKPVIQSVVLYPINVTVGSKINIIISATDNVRVTEVKAGDIQLLEEDKGVWQGSIVAPSSVGSYSLLIKANDSVGNSAEKTKNYKVVSPTGSLGVGISPKTTTAPTSGKTIDYTVKIKSIQNFDDVVRVNVTMDGLPVSYQIPSEWFDWNNQTVNVASNSTISLPLKLTIPPGQAAGKKAFKVRANSTLWTTNAYDSGIITVS